MERASALVSEKELGWLPFSDRLHHLQEWGPVGRRNSAGWAGKEARELVPRMRSIAGAGVGQGQGEFAGSLGASGPPHCAPEC